MFKWMIITLCFTSISIGNASADEGPGILEECLEISLAHKKVCIDEGFHPVGHCQYEYEEKEKKCHVDFDRNTTTDQEKDMTPVSLPESKKQAPKKSKGAPTKGGELAEVSGKANAEMGSTRQQVEKLIQERKGKWDYYLDKVCKKELGSQWNAVYGSVQFMGADVYKPERTKKEDSWCQSWEFCGKARVKGICSKR